MELLALLKRSLQCSNKEKKNNNKMSSDMRSVPDLKMLYIMDIFFSSDSVTISSGYC